MVWTDSSDRKSGSRTGEVAPTPVVWGGTMVWDDEAPAREEEKATSSAARTAAPSLRTLAQLLNPFSPALHARHAG
jgi:hypothetical protein